MLHDASPSSGPGSCDCKWPSTSSTIVTLGLSACSAWHSFALRLQYGVPLTFKWDQWCQSVELIFTHHSSKLNEPPKFLYYNSCHHKQRLVTKEYAVSHLQRHELYHDAFLLQIRFVDCQCFLRTFDFRHWRTVDSWLMNWVHVSIQLWTTLGKRLLWRGVKWTWDWGCFIPSHVPWLTLTLIVSPGMACRHAGRFNEGSGFEASFCWKGRARSKEHNLRILGWMV